MMHWTSLYEGGYFLFLLSMVLFKDCLGPERGRGRGGGERGGERKGERKGERREEGERKGERKGKGGGKEDRREGVMHVSLICHNNG